MKMSIRKKRNVITHADDDLGVADVAFKANKGDGTPSELPRKNVIISGQATTVPTGTLAISSRKKPRRVR